MVTYSASYFAEAAKKAIRRHGVPEKITIDGSAANEAAIKSYNEAHGTAIVIRKTKYLNNIVERSYWIPGSYVTSTSMSAPSNALPRLRTLCTNSKKPR